VTASYRDAELRAEDVVRYLDQQDPSARVCLGVISNPFSRRNARTRLHDRLLPRLVPDKENAVETRTSTDLERALRYLLFERGVNVLALNGGDGTLHASVNAMMRLSRDVHSKTGEPFILPRLLFLNGGTLNIVSRATGTKGNPVRTLKEFLKRGTGQPLSRLETRELAMLKVSVDDGSIRYGFVFGSELVANALEMYTLFGEGYLALTRVLTEVAAGYHLNTRMWQEHGWKLDAPTTTATVDDIGFSKYCCAVAATMNLSLMKGALTAVRAPEGRRGFVAKVITETDKGRLVRLIPKLMTGQPNPAVHDISEAGLLRVIGGFTLDGECFIDRSPTGSRQVVTVTRAPDVLHAIRL
jgi:hypothetical protein